MQALTTAQVADLAELAPRTVRRRACELSGQRSDKPAKNGRRARLFRLQSLSPRLQESFVTQQLGLQEWLQDEAETPKSADIGDPLQTAFTLPGGSSLSAEDQAKAEIRYKVIEPLLKPNRFCGLWLECQSSKREVIDLLAKQHRTNARSIYRWLKAFEDGGLPALVPKERTDKGLPKVLNAAALDFLIAAALPRKGDYGELSVREIYRAYMEERTWRASHANKALGEFEVRKYARYLDGLGRLSPQAQLPAASYETFRSWFNRIPSVVKVLARDGQEAFHNTEEILSFRSLADIRPMDYVVMDHRRLDLFCLVQQHGGWGLVRPWLTAAIDMRTRRWLSWVIVETPSSDSIASVLKRCFIDHGLPGAIYQDNGKDFCCEWLEGRQTKSRTEGAVKELGAGIRGVLETLDVRVHHAIVKRARSKIIEPNFGNTANFDKSLPWWCGHKPTARPERFAGLLDQHEAWLSGKRPDPVFPPIEQVAGLYDEFLQSLNEREHSGEGMQKITPAGRGWMCPNECWEINIGKVERRSVPADVLQFCFAKRRELVVRHGEIRTTFGGKQFHYRFADSSIRLVNLNGRTVQLAYDPLDLEMAAVYHEDRFVGLATCIDLRRMGEEAFVQDERDRRAMLRESKKIIVAVHQAVPVPSYAERAARRQAVAPERIEPARTESPAVVPAAVTEATEAARAERRFSFASTGVELVQRADAASYQDDAPEDEFQFFVGGPIS